MTKTFLTAFVTNSALEQTGIIKQCRTRLDTAELTSDQDLHFLLLIPAGLQISTGNEMHLFDE